MNNFVELHSPGMDLGELWHVLYCAAVKVIVQMARWCKEGCLEVKLCRGS